MKNVLLVIILLISTSAAVKVTEPPGNISAAIAPTQERTYNLTESELIRIIGYAVTAGGAAQDGVFGKSMYDKGLTDYETLYSSLRIDNSYIRQYNILLDDLFNSSTAEKLKLLEISV